MTTDFNYSMYQLSVKIYQYAERVVVFPGDQDSIDYCKNQCMEALADCRANKISWLPVSKEYKGKAKNKAGKTYVAVETPWGLNDYGFLHYQTNASKIKEILHNMWTAFIHGEEIEDIVNRAVVNA